MKHTQQPTSAATDHRNVVDHYKGLPHQAIVADLDEHGSALHIAIDNVVRDFNMGTIVRSANAFGVRHVHIIGRRQWNKRGAMMTDTYLHVHYHQTVEDFRLLLVGHSSRSIMLPVHSHFTRSRCRVVPCFCLGQRGLVFVPSCLSGLRVLLQLSSLAVRVVSTSA